jgi:hypothetical protein
LAIKKNEMNFRDIYKFFNRFQILPSLSKECAARFPLKKGHNTGKIMTGLAVLLFISGCKVPYDPPVAASDTHYLVVEGFINGDGTTTIRLTRTRNITPGDTARYKNELSAIVEIQDQNLHSYPLTEKGGGFYSAGTQLDPSGRYRLHVRTLTNKEYMSDFVDYRQTPPIDNVGWNFRDGGVQVYVNTHDPQNRSRYYRWDYEETWEFHSRYLSTIRYDEIDTSVIDRTESAWDCWRSQSSTGILIGSSAKLSQDVIHEAPLVLIPPKDPRISVLYSILVNQYALDSSAYNYWDAMKSNTENTGSLFDPQPNQTRGNMHCTTDTSEIVIGYVGAGSVQQTRLFIPHSAMPSDWYIIPNCIEKTVPNNKDSLVTFFGDQSYIPYDKEYAGNTVIAYFAASGVCVDCTLFGTNVKPAFWP